MTRLALILPAALLCLAAAPASKAPPAKAPPAKAAAAPAKPAPAKPAAAGFDATNPQGLMEILRNNVLDRLVRARSVARGFRNCARIIHATVRTEKGRGSSPVVA